MTRRILFVNHLTGYLFIDIVNASVQFYDHISLITGKVNKHITELNEKVVVDYISEYKKGGKFSRIIYWLTSTLRIYFLILAKYRKYELFLTSNPPFSPFIVLLLRNKVNILIYDIFPDGLVSDGFIAEEHFINRIWCNLNKRIFKKAGLIFTISDGMAATLSKYCDINKIKVIPLWYSELFSGGKISKGLNPFIQKNDLVGKFIIMYSGNLAPGHDIEALIDLADYLKDHNDIAFIIAGSGWKYKTIENLIKQKELRNCKLFPFLPAEEFKFSLSAADIGVVTISQQAAQLGVPSKVYNLAALGMPLLCIADKNSELSKLVDNYDIGICCKKDEISFMADFIKRIKRNHIDYEYYANKSILCSKDFTNSSAQKFFIEKKSKLSD
jgi:glycosyltransferase involved in cell wall biosynthesis